MTDRRPLPDLSALCTRYLSGLGTNADPMLLGQKSVELKVEATRLLKGAGLDKNGLAAGLQRLDEMIEAALFGPHANPNVPRITYDDGGVYVGTLKEGDPHGEGHVFYPDGEHYKGAFENGLAHGDGVLVSVNGDRREGNFHKGALHGTGRLTQASGEIYEGTFQNDEINGQGRIITDSYSLEGDFKDGIVQGVARLVESNGTVFEGLFEDNNPSDGVLMDTNGTKTKVKRQKGKLYEVAPKKPKRGGSAFMRFLADICDVVTSHPISAVAVVLGLLSMLLPTGGVMSSLGSVRYIFDKHGEAATLSAAEEIATLPASAVRRATSMPVPIGAHTASALGPDIATASSKVFTKIAAQCGASNGSILQTTTAETARGTYADASFCCQGEDICMPPMPDIKPIKVRASIWIPTNRDRSKWPYMLSGDENANLNTVLPPWEAYRYLLSSHITETYAAVDPDLITMDIHGVLDRACPADLRNIREQLDLVKVAIGQHTRVPIPPSQSHIRHGTWVAFEVLFEIVCNKRQLDHYGIRY